MDTSLFGAKLKEQRESLGITQKELSEISGINAANISAYENGVNKPSLEIACRLAASLNVSISSLVEDDKHEEKIPTYKFLLNEYLYLREYLDISIGTDIESNSQYDMDREYTWIKIYNNDTICKMVNDTRKMLQLEKNGTITRDIFEMWLFSFLTKLNRPINDKNTSDTDEELDLPF